MVQTPTQSPTQCNPSGGIPYGSGDASYQAAGGYQGICRLVNEFYDQMESLPQAKRIRRMHSDDLTESRKKLSYFLSGWLGGPKLYRQHYQPIVIPKFHQHMPIGEAERDAWMLCMRRAVAKQPFADDFKHYLIEQLYIPAERTRVLCSKSKS